MAAGDWKEMLSAIEEGNLALVRYHIENGVNPNYQHPELLTTPLIVSIEQEQSEIAAFLLEHEADPGLRAGFSPDTPLSVARKTKNRKLIKLIKTYLKK